MVMRLLLKWNMMQKEGNLREIESQSFLTETLLFIKNYIFSSFVTTFSAINDKANIIIIAGIT